MATQQVFPITERFRHDESVIIKRYLAGDTNRSQMAAYAVQVWADELRDGGKVNADDLRRYIHDYMSAIYMDETAAPKKSIYIRPETDANVDEIGRALDAVDAFVVPGIFLRSKSGYSRSFIVALAMRKLAEAAAA